MAPHLRRPVASSLKVVRVERGKTQGIRTNSVAEGEVKKISADLKAYNMAAYKAARA